MQSPPSRPASEFQHGSRRYLLTLPTAGGRRVFINSSRVSCARSQILMAAERERFVILAYCFMPDRLLLLAVGDSEASDPGRFLADARRQSDLAFSRAGWGRLWDTAFDQRVLREDESTLAVVRYVLSSPVRTGLARSIDDYPFSGLGVFTTVAMLPTVSGDDAWEP